jgi:hypothetical protein
MRWCFDQRSVFNYRCKTCGPTSSVLRLAWDAGVHLLLKEKAWANALLTYGDSAAAYFAAQ